MGKVKINSEFKNYKVSIVENDVISTYPVVDIIADSIEYEDGILKMADAKKFFDSTSGGIHYLFYCDLPAVVEAKNLKLLRRSTAINNLFKYDRNKKFDLMGFMPWVAIIMLVLFK